MKTLIYGSKTFAVVLRQVLIDLEWDFAGYVDDFSTGPEIVGTYAAAKAGFDAANTRIVLGIGYQDLPARAKAAARLETDGFLTPALIHPRAWVHRSSEIGRGAIVMAGAIVDALSAISPWGVLWPGVVVNHECTIGANTFLSPNATVCGCTKVGAGTFVGAGAVIVDQRNVPDGSFIRAGSVFK